MADKINAGDTPKPLNPRTKPTGQKRSLERGKSTRKKNPGQAPAQGRLRLRALAEQQRTKRRAVEPDAPTVGGLEHVVRRERPDLELEAHQPRAFAQLARRLGSGALHALRALEEIDQRVRRPVERSRDRRAGCARSGSASAQARRSGQLHSMPASAACGYSRRSSTQRRAEAAAGIEHGRAGASGTRAARPRSAPAGVGKSGASRQARQG